MRPSFETADRYRRGHPRRRPLGRYRYVRIRWRLLFTCLDWFGWCLVRLAAAVRRRLRLSTPTIPAEPRSILLVQLDHLGDAIISTAMLPLLRARYPQASIDVLASPWNEEVFAACREVDRIFVSRVNRFAPRRRYLWLPALLGWAWRLRGRRYDLAIDIRGEFPLALLLWLCGARRRLGWDCGGGGFLLTDSPRFVLRRPEVESRLALLAELGIASPAAADGKGPRFKPSDATRRHISQRLAETSDSDRPLFALHLGAGTTAKRWPLDLWERLIARLVSEYHAQVALVGGEDDRALAAGVMERFSPVDVSDWTGTLRLDETAALLEHAELFVGADSGPAHLAAAVGAPVVVLFSGTNDSRQWRPWGPMVGVVRHEVACSPCHRTECFWADHPCMRGLSVAAVMHEAKRLLRESRRAIAAQWSGVATASRASAKLPAGERTEPFAAPRFLERFAR